MEWRKCTICAMNGHSVNYIYVYFYYIFPEFFHFSFPGKVMTTDITPAHVRSSWRAWENAQLHCNDTTYTYYAPLWLVAGRPISYSMRFFVVLQFNLWSLVEKRMEERKNITEKWSTVTIFKIHCTPSSLFEQRQQWTMRRSWTTNENEKEEKK